VVLLNGAGSVGKTTVARELQSITRDPFLHVPMDAFLEMLPQQSFGTPDGLTFETINEDGHPSVVIHSGPLASRTFRGMRHAVAAMAALDSNMIVDDVLLPTELDEYRELLQPFHLSVVRLFAPLEVLEQRERARGDRLEGLARWQHRRVHEGVDYDLSVDTGLRTAAECAQLIKATLVL
jgi:chloramphenicol 3-O phosphotransferase